MSLLPPFSKARLGLLLIASLAGAPALGAEENTVAEATLGLEENAAVRVSDGHLLRVRNLTRNLFRGESVTARSVESIHEQARLEHIAERRQSGEVARIVHGEAAVSTTPVVERDGKQAVFASGHLFEAREWHFDAFFAYADDVQTGGAGGGVALAYYPSRYVGFGLEALAFSDLTQDGSAAALAYFRLPIDALALAFHLVGGVGGSFDSGEFSAQFQLGAGMEIRLLYEWGLLFDFRLAQSPGENSHVTARAGFRHLF